jgi:hypothetical protein
MHVRHAWDEMERNHQRRLDPGYGLPDSIITNRFTPKTSSRKSDGEIGSYDPGDILYAVAYREPGTKNYQVICIQDSPEWLNNDAQGKGPLVPLQGAIKLLKSWEHAAGLNSNLTQTESTPTSLLQGETYIHLDDVTLEPFK